MFWRDLRYTKTFLTTNCLAGYIIDQFQSQHIKDIKTSVLYVNNQPNLVTLDYEMDVSEVYPELEAEHK